MHSADSERSVTWERPGLGGDVGRSEGRDLDLPDPARRYKGGFLCKLRFP